MLILWLVHHKGTILNKVNTVWIKYSADCAPILSTLPSSWWRGVGWGNCSCWPTSTWSHLRWSFTLETPFLKTAAQGSLGNFADLGETADLIKLRFDFFPPLFVYQHKSFFFFIIILSNSVLSVYCFEGKSAI